jgi:uncharacterized protein with PQ loop repeat
MPVTPAEAALGLFAICNTARVFAYVPQIVKIGRDRHGAAAISYTTWALFALSHLSTVAYALLVVDDPWMAAMFAANTLCCLVILGLTAWKRALFRAIRSHAAVGEPPLHPAAPLANRPAPERPAQGDHPHLAVVAGGPEALLQPR